MFISIQNLTQLKSSSFIQVCQFSNPETLNSISSWSFPVRDFPTLQKNFILCNNQALLILIVISFLQFFFCHSTYLSCSLLSLHMPLQNTQLLSASGISLLSWFFHSTQQYYLIFSSITSSILAAVLFIIIFVVAIIIIILLLLLLLLLLSLLSLLLLLLLLLLFIILYYARLNKKKKKKDCTTYDMEIVCLTMEIQICFIEPKYEQQVSRP